MPSFGIDLSRITHCSRSSDWSCPSPLWRRAMQRSPQQKEKQKSVGRE